MSDLMVKKEHALRPEPKSPLMANTVADADRALARIENMKSQAIQCFDEHICEARRFKAACETFMADIRDILHD